MGHGRWPVVWCPLVPPVLPHVHHLSVPNCYHAMVASLEQPCKTRVDGSMQLFILLLLVSEKQYNIQRKRYVHNRRNKNLFFFKGYLGMDPLPSSKTTISPSNFFRHSTCGLETSHGGRMHLNKLPGFHLLQLTPARSSSQKFAQKYSNAKEQKNIVILMQ